MRTKAPFSPNNSAGENFDVALLGKYAGDNSAWAIFQQISSWPTRNSGRSAPDARAYKALLKLLLPVMVATWPKSHKEEQWRTTDPRVYFLLRTLLPAIEQRDAKPFRLIADAIEAQNGNSYPAFHVHLFVAFEAADIAKEAGLNGNSKSLPITFTEFFRRVEKRVEKRNNCKIDPGHLHRVCKQLGFSFIKARARGGRPTKSR